MTTYEAAVIGAGPTGLVAALALARMGIEVALVGPGVRPCGSDPRTPPADQRTSALMRPSIQLLKNVGVWEMGSDPQGLTPSAPIAAVRIADDRRGLIRAPELLFRASELGLESFGANIANPILLAGLRTAAERAARLVGVETAGVTSLAPGAQSVRLELAEGGAVEAALAVAADGRNSIARKAAGIAADTWAYPQAALATSFRHS
ncbi:MAG TPA: FAD-dependent monooxygenase, partial [Arthrobacter sp.]|nr:FAD-dependent monooxygenase [Arthrobacter sp.]